MASTATLTDPHAVITTTGNLHTDQGREIMELFKRLNEGGTTIVQVTHSEVNASYGRRIIKLKDGWIVDE